jgi:hypothetical protein
MIYGRKLEIDHGRIGEMPTGARVDRSGAGMPLDGTLLYPGGHIIDTNPLGTLETKVLAGSAAFEATARNRRIAAPEPPTRRTRTLDERLRALGIRTS